MKRIVVSALALSLAAGSSFAMSGSQLQNGVQNDYSRIAPGAEVPALSASQLGVIRGVLSDTDASDSEKRSRVEFYIEKFTS